MVTPTHSQVETMAVAVARRPAARRRSPRRRRRPDRLSTPWIGREENAPHANCLRHHNRVMESPLSRDLVPLLWICGTSGVGKSTVGWELFRDGVAEGVATAYVDIDQLGMCLPRPSDDERGDAIKARNLAAVVTTFLAAGAERIIVSGTVDAAASPLYSEVLSGVSLTWCQLDVDDDTLRQRLIRRAWPDELIDFCLDYAQSLSASGFAHVAIDTTGLAVSEVVDRIPEVPLTSDVGLPCTRSIFDMAAPGEWPLVMLITGGRAVGKSTIGWQIFERTQAMGTRIAFLDLRQLSFFQSSRLGNASNDRVKIENAAALCRNFAAAGAGRVVLGGEVASVAQLATALTPAELSTYILTASPERIRERAVTRAEGGGPRLVGDDLPALDELEAPEMNDDGYVDAAVIDTTDMTVDQVVSRVIENTKDWLP